MRYPKLRELKEAIKALVKGPCTSKFPFEPHEPFDGFRGKPTYFEEGCVGCTACAQVCPAGAIDFEDVVEGSKHVRRFVLHLDKCQFCGNCQAACITNEGIKLTKEYDFACFDRENAVSKVEKELILCQDCGDTIGCKDHLIWLSKKLGPLAFGNPTLFLPALENLSLVDKETFSEIGDLKRSDFMKVLCAKCKRKTVLNR